MNSCEECWDNPCTCGHSYKDWPLEKLQEQIEMLELVIEEKS